MDSPLHSLKVVVALNIRTGYDKGVEPPNPKIRFVATKKLLKKVY